MPKRLIKLTPLEPYFFGGERIHVIGDNNKHYFIRSLDTPSQTALFGALRYIGIKSPSSQYSLSEDDERIIGTSSYKLDANSQVFGKINSISPLYLMDKDGALWVPTPFDHNVSKPKGTAEQPKYTRFENYSELIETSQGKRLFPMEYNAKEGLTDSWLCLKNRWVRDDLFQGVTQVGIDKQHEKKAFFKKEYKRLEDGFSFAFFADYEKGFSFHQKIVYLGQGKSPFQVEYVKEIAELAEPKSREEWLKPEIVYAQSDIYYTDDIQALYKLCKFVCVKTRPYRIFENNYRNRLNSNTVQLLQAGSVFWPDNAADFKKKLENDHAVKAGFNIIIGGNAK